MFLDFEWTLHPLRMLKLLFFLICLVSSTCKTVFVYIVVFNNVIFQGTAMEEMDFEQRRELRRQKREEMRLEAER